MPVSRRRWLSTSRHGDGYNGNNDVTQIAVLVVHDDDVTVQQSSTTMNLGVANADGGTAVGNSSTNTVTQTTVRH